MKVVQVFELYNFHVDHFSEFQIDFELEVQIERGHSLEICIFKITLNFILKLQKLKTPKLYILTRSTTLLWNSTSNFAWFLNYAKWGNYRVQKSGFPPLSLRKTFTLGFNNQLKHQYTR